MIILKKVMTIRLAMDNKVIFALKYRNVITLQWDWPYGDYTPLYYYYYSPLLRSYKYTFVYKAKNFVMYERI